MKKTLESKIKRFEKAYNRYNKSRKTYYTSDFEYENFKHFFIFKNSNEIAFAFETEEEIEDFLDTNLERIENH